VLEGRALLAGVVCHWHGALRVVPAVCLESPGAGVTAACASDGSH
jgi:hypothetical protein